MLSFFAIAPDFLIILLGAFIKKYLKLDQGFWRQAERLVFYVLLPPLLFSKVASTTLDLSDYSLYVAVAIGIMLFGAVMAWIAGYASKNDLTRASVFQCGFRFNNYIAFSLVMRLFGEEGMSLLALILSFWIPMSNILAVSALAPAVERAGTQRGAKHKPLWEVVLTNPLILATVLGFAFNLAGIRIPDVLNSLFTALGNASLALGLLCIGASLKFSEFGHEVPIMIANSLVRLVLLPVAGYLGMVVVMGFPPLLSGVFILFAAVPTAQSCYVMTSAMGGDGTTVANITTLQILVSIPTLFFWVAIIESLA